MTEQIQTRLTVKPSQARSAIIKAILAKRVPMLHGSPAIGKSSIVAGIAKQFNLKLLDVRLSLMEPTDLQGFPHIDKAINKSDYVPMMDFPVKGDPLPVELDDDGKVTHTYAGWLLFLDELTSAKQEVQAPAYKLILDHKVGRYDLHSKVAIVGAGNKESDNAIVYPMSTALQSRMAHLELELDLKEWLDWAMADKQMDHRITDFIQFKPDSLYTFDPNHTGLTYAAPRTWEFTDDFLKVCQGDVKDPDFIRLASGTITEGVTREFLTFCDIYAELPAISDIMMVPRSVPVPREPSILFALTGSIAAHADDKNTEKLMEYVVRLPLEFQVVTLRSIIKRDRKMLANPGVSKWVAEHGADLF